MDKSKRIEKKYKQCTKRNKCRSRKIKREYANFMKESKKCGYRPKCSIPIYNKSEYGRLRKQEKACIQTNCKREEDSYYNEIGKSIRQQLK